MYEICDRLVVIDTQIALSPRVSVSDGDRTYSGLRYREHDEDADGKEKYEDLWASIDNDESFWFTHPSLCNLIADAGFTSMLRIENPDMPATAIDRQTYVAVKGRRAEILSSHLTNNLVGLASAGVQRRADEHDTVGARPALQIPEGGAAAVGQGRDQADSAFSAAAAAGSDSRVSETNPRVTPPIRSVSGAPASWSPFRRRGSTCAQVPERPLPSSHHASRTP